MTLEAISTVAAIFTILNILRQWTVRPPESPPGEALRVAEYQAIAAAFLAVAVVAPKTQ